MRIFQKSSVTFVLLSIALNACQGPSEKASDIFNVFTGSDFFMNESENIRCNDTTDFPNQDFSSLCFKLKPQTITDVKQAGELGLSIGLKISALVKQTDWKIIELSDENGENAVYRKPVSDRCFDELFLRLDEGDFPDQGPDDYPLQFAPIVNIYKTRQPVCSKGQTD